jgi:glycine cleavage system regulatory protein
MIVALPRSGGPGRYDAAMTDLVLTLIGPDHPGIVEKVSEVVAANGGNWLDSRMAHLAGKFAGVLCVKVPDDHAAALEEALCRLEASGLTIVVERSVAADMPRRRAMEIELVGFDRAGLVHQVAALLAEHRINVEELTTDRSAAAHSGDPLFRARARVGVPEDVDLDAVRQGIERLAADLMVDIRLVESSDTAVA